MNLSSMIYMGSRLQYTIQVMQDHNVQVSQYISDNNKTTRTQYKF